MPQSKVWRANCTQTQFNVTDVEACGDVTPAYTVQFHLNKFKPGSPTYNKVLHLKQMMEERGAVFPAPTPAEIRASRARR